MKHHFAELPIAQLYGGESALSARRLPPLTTGTPACGPLWRLFDGEPMHPMVARQARALCVRCGLNDSCSRKIT